MVSSLPVRVTTPCRNAPCRGPWGLHLYQVVPPKDGLYERRDRAFTRTAFLLAPLRSRKGHDGPHFNRSKARPGNLGRDGNRLVAARSLHQVVASKLLLRLGEG